MDIYRLHHEQDTLYGRPDGEVRAERDREFMRDNCAFGVLHTEVDITEEPRATDGSFETAACDRARCQF